MQFGSRAAAVAVATLGAAATGCLIDRSPLESGEDARVIANDARALDEDARPPVDLDAFLAPADSAALDAPREGDAQMEPDSDRPDAGSDAGPCPDGPTGSGACPFTTLGQLMGVEGGTYDFSMADLAFRAVVDDGDGGGWMLIASADDATRGRVRLMQTMTGPVTRQSHDIFAPEIVAALADAREVRIDSTPGSPILASVRSDDAYVLGQLRDYRSLHAVAAEAGSVRWRGADTPRMTSTCNNVAPESLDRLIFQTCGAGGENLHWGPDPMGLGDNADALNRWVYRSGPRDRLNLWVRH